MKHLLFASLISITPLLAAAQDMVTYTSDMSFDDATFAIESAIVDAGLIVDHVSHVGEMLERTR
jgi:uncharacterized protein (DUF302 family)